MGARDHDLRASGGISHLDHIDLDALALAQHLAGDLFAGDKIDFGFVQRQRRAAAVNARHHATEQLMLTALIFVVNLISLVFADALDDDLFGVLRRYSPEVVGIDLLFHDVANSIFGVDGLRLLQRQLGAGRLNFLDHRATRDQFDGLGVLIDQDGKGFGACGVFSKGGEQAGLNFLQHVFLGDASLFFQLLKRLKQLAVVHVFRFSYPDICKRSTIPRQAAPKRCRPGQGRRLPPRRPQG